MTLVEPSSSSLRVGTTLEGSGDCDGDGGGTGSGRGRGQGKKPHNHY